MKRQHSTANTSQDFPEKEARQPKRFFVIVQAGKFSHFSSLQAETFKESSVTKLQGVAPGTRRGERGAKHAEGVRERGKTGCQETLSASRKAAKGQNQGVVPCKQGKF